MGGQGPSTPKLIQQVKQGAVAHAHRAASLRPSSGNKATRGTTHTGLPCLDQRARKCIHIRLSCPNSVLLMDRQ